MLDSGGCPLLEDLVLDGAFRRQGLLLLLQAMSTGIYPRLRCLSINRCEAQKEGEGPEALQVG